MQAYKKEFIQLAIEYEVLRFGEFELKSGRVSPYFFNVGLFNTGRALSELGAAYAKAMLEENIECDVLFGPAYKGIPLVSAMAVALSAIHGMDKPYAFNRKEAKDHGEGGTIVGAPLAGRVLIVDDVITAGTAIREAVDIIQAQGGEPAAVLIAMDRQEKGLADKSAIQEVRDELGLCVHSIITLAELIEYMESDEQYAEHLFSMKAYRYDYGV